MDTLKEFYNRNKKNIDNTLTILLTFTIIFVFVRYVYTYVAPFVVGFVIYLILDPIATLLERKLKFPRWLASLVAIFFLITVIGSIGTLLVISFISQGRGLMENSSIYIEQFNLLLNRGEDFFINLFFLVPQSLKELSVDFFAEATDAITVGVTQLVKSSSLALAKTVPKTIVYVFIGLISSFFMLKDKVIIKAFLKSKSPKFLSSSYINIRKGMIFAFGGYVKSQLILMSCTGVIAFIGLTILGSEYSLFISFLIAIIDALPLFGSGFILWPWALYFLIVGEYSSAIILFSTYLTVLLFRQIMEPRVLGDQIGLHPLVTLMSIYVGLNLFGVLGLIIGPVSIVICKSIFDNNK